MAKAAMSPILQTILSMVDDQRVKELCDRELLRRFVVEHDEGAFQTILHRHGPVVFNVCRIMLANQADAEDAFQATFLVFARKAVGIRKATSLGSWLYGVAYRIALKSQAEFAKRKKHECLVPTREFVESADDLTWRDVKAVIHRELNGLPERYRAILVLCYLEGKTQDEVAHQLKLPKGTLKGRLERGRELLRARLVRRGFGPAAVLVASGWSATESAAMPLTLVESTARMVASLAAERGVSGFVSAKVVALTEGVVKAMFITKLRTMIVMLLALGMVGSGIGVRAYFQGTAHAQPDHIVGTPKDTVKLKVDKEEPSERTRKAVEMLKDNLDDFGLSLSFSGDLKEPFHTIGLATACKNKAKTPPHWLGDADLGKEGSAKVIDYLASSGFFDRASVIPSNDQEGRVKFYASKNQPYYSLQVSAQYHEILGWDIMMLHRLEGLRKALDGDAAKLMDKLLATLEPKRKEWEKAKDKSNLEGTWTAISMERDGKSISEKEVKEFDIQLTFKGDEFMLMPFASKGPEHFPQGQFNIDTTTNPKSIDLTIDLPFSPAKKTSTMLGIYELDGDRLKLLQAPPDQGRPTEFKTTPKSGMEFIVFKRAKGHSEQTTDGQPVAPDADRAAAEWLLSVGGSIQTAAGYFEKKDPLGDGPFKITAIRLASNDQIKDDDLARFAELTKLNNLFLAETPIGDAGLKHLAGLKSLESLYLPHTKVGDAGLAHLKGLTGLVNLYLDETKITDAGLEHLTGMTGLRVLYLRHTQITDAGLKYLKAIPNLCWVDLWGSKVTDAGVKKLQAALPRCTIKNVDPKYDRPPAPPKANPPVDARAAAVTAIKQLGGKVEYEPRHFVTGNDDPKEKLAVSLRDRKVTDADLKHLKELTDLAHLELRGTPINDAGLAHLEGLTKLEEINLYDTTVGDVGLEHLKGLTKLRFLMLKQTNVTDAGVKKLKQALPDCEISHSPRNPPRNAPIVLLAGRWNVEFANGVKQTCEIREDETASVAEPGRTSGGKVGVQNKAIVIAYDDDRVERWTLVGKRLVVEHWAPVPGSPRWAGHAPLRPLPTSTPVLGIAERAP